jgi:hypothetical protein
MTDSRGLILGTEPIERTDWLNPIAMSQLRDVVEVRGRTAVLNGIRYDLTYGHYVNFPVSGERLECVRLKRADGGYVPFGYLQVRRVLSFEFDGNV